MDIMGRRKVAVFAIGCTLLQQGQARAQPADTGLPSGVDIIDALGDEASSVLAPSGQLSVLWRIDPAGPRPPPEMVLIAPGIGRTTMAHEQFRLWRTQHPEFADVMSEVSPPVHTLLELAGDYTQVVNARRRYDVDGTGVLIGITDTGIDPTHWDFRDARGHTRIAWLLDLSRPPLGKYPELEEKFGKTDPQGRKLGAVYDAEELDRLLFGPQFTRKREWTGPVDDMGHGTQVASIAAGNGQTTKRGRYVGMAPKAEILVARVTPTGNGSSVLTNDLVQGAAFLFDRAQAMHKPIVVNMSVGTDYGPHDGNTLWETALASFVGPEPEKQGRALVAAAGNTGSTKEFRAHQSVFVPPGGTMRVPITTYGAKNGSMRVWVAKRGGANLDVGLEGPDGATLMKFTPEGKGRTRKMNGGAPKRDAGLPGAGVAGLGGGHSITVVNGSSVRGGSVPSGSRAATVFVNGNWPAGTYTITLSGSGTADLYLETSGNVERTDGRSKPPGAATTPDGIGFVNPQRSGTINLPASNSTILAVGCTVNRSGDSDGSRGDIGVSDDEDDVATRVLGDPAPASNVASGDICYFSSAGPNALGVTKPEIAAPGSGVIASRAFGRVRVRPVDSSNCPRNADGRIDSKECDTITRAYGMANGTSFSAPMVSGAIALLFQKDPSLTQDRIVTLIQAGAHPFRGAVPFSDQSGPGELDVIGSLDALEQSQNPTLALPSATKSWMTLPTQFAAADGRTPLHVILELRTADGTHRADAFDLVRLRPYAHLSGTQASLSPPKLERKGPGLFTFDVIVPAGNGGASLTVGTTFDGKDIVTPKTIAVATDAWNAEYGSTVKGGCSLSGSHTGDDTSGAPWLLPIALFPLLVRRRRERPPVE